MVANPDPKTERQVLATLIILAISNSTLLPLIPYLISDRSYLEGLKGHALGTGILSVLSILGWYVVRPFAINVLHSGKAGDLPWYASPLLWLIPIFVVIMYVMFSR
jgi:hypothetical protein